MKVRMILAILSAAAALLPAGARADVKLPKIIDSHMVLQRDKLLPIWGWADPGEDITVLIDDHKLVGKADDKGNWKVKVPALKADGKAHEMTIKGKNEIKLTDILIGEVWIGSGQSNMEMTLASSQGGKEAIVSAKHPNIRLFHVPRVPAKTPARDIVLQQGQAGDAKWKVCSPEAVPQFSGVLYFFGLKLHKDLDVPIGLINSSWGGSPIEPWTVTEKGSGVMYNGMIAPLQPFAIRGVTWYQGESNVFSKDGMKYYGKMNDLITGWRKVWGKNMPFYFVQIAPWANYPSGEEPALWEAQVASLKIPHTGMSVITDLVANIKDIHPVDKKDVGDRLALWALAKTYGNKDIVYSGPLYESMKIEGGKIRLSFAHAADGLKARDGKPLSEFQIAGKDGKLVPAKAIIEGKTLLVSAEGIDAPTQVRFGWRKTANPNLMNSAGLPASPFQTNNWQGGTGK